jgi:16S rRNA C967 or C1407 C5-methylase (RsmB/RsmF family)
VNIFENYYRELFPSDFESIMEGLKQPTKPVLRFAAKNEKRMRKLWKEAGLEWKVLDWCSCALKWPKGVEIGETLPGTDEGLFYVQNASSLLPVLALDPQPDDRVLDCCAAPGGKALFIWDLMQGEGELLANDISNARRGRMRRIFAEHDCAAKIMGRNAASFGGTHKEYFDRILLDAPCSSEKHVLNSPRHLKEWKPGRVRHLRKLQWRLIQALFKALKPGGRLVYSTCSITPEENEELIKRFVHKLEGGVKLIKEERIWPHKQENMDPMFIAVFEKV